MKGRVGMRTYVAVISLGAVGVTLGIGVVSPALPELQKAFDLTNGQIGWVVSANVLPGVILTVPFGILGDAVGRRLVFCSALVVYGAAGVAQGLTDSYAVLVTMRLLQGCCFAAAMPLTITLLGDAFRGEERMRAVAGRNATLTSSEVVLPLVGAFLGAISWRAPLFVQAVTIPLALYSFTIIHEQKRSTGPRGEYARDLIHLLRTQRGMVAVLYTSFSRYFFKFAILAFLPILLVNERDASLTQVGIVLSTSYLFAVVTNTRVPSAIKRVRPSLAAIASVIVIGATIAAFAFVPDWRWAFLVGAVYGIADGVIAVLQDTYTIHTASSHVRAGMVSVSQTVRNLGKFASPVLMTLILSFSTLQVAFLGVALVGIALVPLLLPLRGMDGELQSKDFDAHAEAQEVSSSGEGTPYE